MSKTNIAALGFVLLVAAIALAQTPAEPTGFEVASVKPSDPSSQGPWIHVAPGGLFTADNVSLKLLIGQAWDLRDFQISGGPGWLDSDRYDITAKAPELAISDEDLHKMTDQQRLALQDKFRRDLQLLLEERFQLRSHRETRDVPVYTLTVSKNGSKLQPLANPDPTTAGLHMQRTNAGLTELTGTDTALANLAKSLSSQLGRTVIDQTGLAGNYDFRISYTPNLDTAQQSENAGPSVFTALEEQLGLRLESNKGLVEIFVIDSAQKASPN